MALFYLYDGNSKCSQYYVTNNNKAQVKSNEQSEVE